MTALRCRPGDLAVAVRSAAGNEGKVFTCLRLATPEEAMRHNMYDPYAPRWVIDQPIRTSTGHEAALYLDAWLRPLRDNDGEDEMLRIVPLPLPTIRPELLEN